MSVSDRALADLLQKCYHLLLLQPFFFLKRDCVFFLCTLSYMVFLFYTTINFQIFYGQETAGTCKEGRCLRRSARRIPVMAIFWFSYLLFYLFLGFFFLVLETFALFVHCVALMVLNRKCREMNDLADLWEISKYNFIFKK